MKNKRTYAGIHNDHMGGMTPTGTLIRDAWVFGILPEEETCEGWTNDRLQQLYDQVSREWDKYGVLASNLPPDLRSRHERIHGEAIKTARAKGWAPDLDEND